jgi:uncharacterized membrane protein
MNKGRLEGFSDGVLAVIITIMVLELKIPHGTGVAAVAPLVPVFLVYLLSFVKLTIHWKNHHHLMHAAEHVTGGALWANMHLLLWLSLFPFVMGWMGENHFAPVPAAAFGIVAIGAAIANLILTRVLLASHEADSLLARGIGGNRKRKLSVLMYAAAIPLAFVHAIISLALYTGVALIWLVPDRRFERLLTEQHQRR